MKGMLYVPGRAEPAAVLDEVKVIEYNDNHPIAPWRIFFTTRSLNAGKMMLELVRDDRLRIELDDGRSGYVLMQEQSMDAEGRSVGVLRVLGRLSDPAAQSASVETVVVADPTAL